MAVMICRCCALELSLPAGAELMTCPACGTVNAHPHMEGFTLDLLANATRLRLTCEFHRAMRSYEHVLDEYPDAHEALWGAALCRYGVEYVDDPASGRRLPVVHTVLPRPMREDADCRRACEMAPEEIRSQYEADAAYIDKVQAEIRRQAERCPDFDIFLCHKTSGAHGEGYSEDYNRASKLYMLLKLQGYRVFFAPMELDGVAGANYEAGIYRALHTAKVMLVVCSSRENVYSAWVQSEWKRFIRLMDEGGSKRLVPLLYGGFQVDSMPKEFRNRSLQALTMEDVDAKETLLAVVGKCVGRAEAPRVEARPVEAPRPAPAPAPKPADNKAYSPEWDFETRENGDECMITRYVGPGGDVVVPPVIRGKRVVGISGEERRRGFGLFSSWRGAFQFCDKVISVDLPEGIRQIDREALYNSGIRRVRLPEGLTMLGDKAFYDCQELLEVNLPASLARMGKSVFKDCGKLWKVTLPWETSKLQVISEDAFHGCISLTQFSFPAGLRVIERSAFSGCSLRNVALPEGLREIGEYALSSVQDSMRTILIPRSVTTLGYACLGQNYSRPVYQVYRGSSGEAYVKKEGFRYEVID